MAVRNVEAALKEKEDSLSTLQEATRAQEEEAQGFIGGKYPRFRILLDSSLPQLIFCSLVQS